VVRIPHLQLVIVSDFIALRSDTWHRQIDLLGTPRKDAEQKMMAEAALLKAAGWRVLDEREECRRHRQSVRQSKTPRWTNAGPRPA